MFYYLNGKIALLEAGLAVVDCGGVGFACRTTAHTLSQLQPGQSAKLFTYTNVREDALELYGFADREELRCFQLLLGVGGVGPKAALSILGVLSPERLRLAIMTGDEKALTAAPGVGKKMAQRMLLELKDKLGIQTELDFSMPTSSVPEGSAALAMAALAELGYSQSEIGAAMKGIPTEGMRTEDIVRQALRAMVMA